MGIELNNFISETSQNQIALRRTGNNKDQPFLNRRRGAMRRRVHQVRAFQNPLHVDHFVDNSLLF